MAKFDVAAARKRLQETNEQCEMCCYDDPPWSRIHDSLDDLDNILTELEEAYGKA